MCLLGFEVLQALVPVQVCVPGITENQKGPSLSLWLPPGLLGSEGTALLSALHCPPRPLAVGCLGEALGHCVVISLSEVLIPRLPQGPFLSLGSWAGADAQPSLERYWGPRLCSTLSPLPSVGRRG